MPTFKNLLIFIPTYNEAENINEIINLILNLRLDADLLFVDDNSPDGTGKLLDEISRLNDRIHVEHREGKLGIGSAHKYGINWAKNHGYNTLITMDCDLTHSPEDIKEFIKSAEKNSVLVGSRYLDKNSLNGWSLKRLALTKLGHTATHFFLGMPYDATGAFRLYQLDLIPENFLGLVQSNSYSFFFESLFILHQNSVSIGEVSTILPPRTYGHSKMQLKDTLLSIQQLVRLFFVRTLNPKSLIIPKDRKDIKLDPSLVDPQDWDSYWELGDRKKTHFLYNLIAQFYRKFIIKPNLNKFVLKTFLPDDSILHAGCGSGQVDSDISKLRPIIALDISPKALFLYEAHNPNVARLVHGSIFNIPLENSSLQGVYNLGVMEHFTENEIHLTLQEFHRVLSPKGRIILFWPHKFGSSVMALGLAHKILNKVSKKKVQLHPPEITYIHSKSQAELILKKSGFKMIEYSFSIADVFTQAIIVGEKIDLPKDFNAR
jgi:dolichol-phosphate mannosyltransferase